MINLLNVCYTITTQCSRKCFYCMTKTNQQDSQALYKLVIQKLASLAIPVRFYVSGGEPTLSPNLIDCLLYAKKYKFRLGLASNGNPNFNWKDLNVIQDSDHIIVITLHYPFWDFDESIIQDLNYRIQIAYVPEYKEHIEKVLNKYKSPLLVPMYHDSISYTDKDYTFIKDYNKDKKKQDSVFLENKNNSKCTSSGIVITPEGKWSRCSYLSNELLPIYLTKNEILLQPQTINCKYKTCFSRGCL